MDIEKLREALIIYFDQFVEELRHSGGCNQMEVHKIEEAFKDTLWEYIEQIIDDEFDFTQTLAQLQEQEESDED